MNCPDSIQSNKVNIANHLKTIKEAALGPADPRKSNEDFWIDKGQKWGITEGDARGRLCMNCEHYIETPSIQYCINTSEAKGFKTSSVPHKPPLVDIESQPVAWCSLHDITCSPTRTCDDQEMGGPIYDDEEYASLKNELE